MVVTVGEVHVDGCRGEGADRCFLPGLRGSVQVHVGSAPDEIHGPALGSIRKDRGSRCRPGRARGVGFSTRSVVVRR